jgi:hypothetical protein
LLWTLFIALLLAAGIQSLFRFHPPERQDLPWTDLDLRDPIGLFTQPKIAALDRDPARCHTLMKQAGIGYTALPPHREGATCGWHDGVRLRSTSKAPRPRVPLACPAAAGVEVWMAKVVQPAAVEMLGSRIVAVDDFGSYACRRLYGRAEGGWSEHATANAIDIAGFRLADGRRITVARDWRDGAKGEFLHAVRDGACRVFGTTLSPDYNAAHRDHLHLDEARRGGFGWRMCG